MRAPGWLPESPRQTAQPIRVGRDGELADKLSLVADQAHIEPPAAQIQPSVQHVSGPPSLASSMNTRSVSARRPSFHGSPKRERDRRRRGLLLAQDKQAPRPAFGEEQAPDHEPAGTCVDLRTVLAGLLPTRLEVPEGPERGWERRPLDPSLFGS
jgi:hypothetical protein